MQRASGSRLSTRLQMSMICALMGLMEAYSDGVFEPFHEGKVGFLQFFLYKL